MFHLLILFLLQTLVAAAPIQKRAYAFVTLTKPPTYVTINAEGANNFVTDAANGATFYSTQWPAPTQEPAPAAPPPAETNDYNTVLVSTASPNGPNTDAQLATSVEEKFPEASVTTSQAPIEPTTSASTTQAADASSETAALPTTSPAAESTTAEPTTESATIETTTSPTPEPTTPEPTTPEPTPSTTTTSTINEPTPAAPMASQDASGKLAAPEYLVYSPYLDTSGCKDYGTVLNDLQLIKSKGTMKLRIYGTDCNVMNTILPAAASLGMTLSQGIWIGPDGMSSAVQDSMNEVIAYGQKNGWGLFENIVLGNEDVVNGYISVDDLINAAKSFKANLRAAGYNGPLLHAEVTNIIQQNPALCGDVFDIVALNAHSYFDPYSTADQSGPFVKGQLGIVQSVCQGKQVWISETGYPSQGKTNGGQVPTKENQLAAVQSIYDNVGTGVVILSTFNDMWKNPGPYGVEQYFGVIDLLS